MPRVFYRAVRAWRKLLHEVRDCPTIRRSVDAKIVAVPKAEARKLLRTGWRVCKHCIGVR